MIAMWHFLGWTLFLPAAVMVLKDFHVEGHRNTAFHAAVKSLFKILFKLLDE